MIEADPAICDHFQRGALATVLINPIPEIVQSSLLCRTAEGQAVHWSSKSLSRFMLALDKRQPALEFDL
jgi:hypothetical protein